MDINIIMGIAIFVLIMLSGFFSSTETAFSSVNTIRLRHYAEKGNKKAKTALFVTDNYDKALTTILIGNNIVNIGSSALATVLCINLFGDAGAAISTGVITLLVLTFGEVLPKSLAKEYAEIFCLKTAGALKVLMTIFSPFVHFFILLKKFVLKLISKDNDEPSVTEDELKYIIESIEEEGVLEEQESNLVQSALDFDEQTVQEILTPRVDITAINVNDKIEDVAKLIISERYSRIPVYGDSIDNILGILHTRDFLECLVNGEKPTVKKLIQPAYFIYKTKKLSKVLADFKLNKLNIAIVTDDYGGTVGIVTMEDLLEELVGEIWDEDEEIQLPYKLISDNCYEVNGDLNLAELLELFDLNSDYIDVDSVSVGGLVFESLGYIPKKDEILKYKEFEIKVLDVSEQRVNTLEITYIPKKEEVE